MKEPCPSVTLYPAEQRPPVENMGCAPFSLVVNSVFVRSIRTLPPRESASRVSRDQSPAETVGSARTTTSLRV